MTGRMFGFVQRHDALGAARLSLLAVALIGLTPHSSHAETLTRGKAIHRALNQNPQVAAARAREAQSEARGNQANAARFPSVNIIAGVGPSLRASLVPGSAVASTENAYGDVGFDDLSVVVGGRLEVIQPLYTFGKISKREQAAKHELRALQAQTAMTRAELALEVARLYESWLLAREIGRFFDETLHWLERTLEDTQAQLAEGKGAAEQDVLRLEAAIGAIKLGIHQAEAGMRQAEGGLAAYLALPSGTRVEIKETELALLPSQDPRLNALKSLALKRRPEAMAAREGAKAYRALAEAESADNLPDFFVMAFASGAYTPGRDTIETRYVVDPLKHFVPGGLLGVRWQWSSGGMANERARENEAKARELEHLNRWAEHGMPAEVTKAVEDLKRATLDLGSTQEAVQVAKKWLVRASADHSIGFGDVRDVTEAATAYVQLRVAYFDAIFRHNVALAELAKVTGTLNDEGRNRFYPTKD
jgi:outer membrane protein TolC